MPPHIQQNVPLAPYTTLGCGGVAEFFAEVRTDADLFAIARWALENGHRITVLGGGSNVLVRDEGISGVVIRMVSRDVTYEERGDKTIVTADAGVILDDLVAELVSRELWGLENLSYIPGTVGAVPVQNVGAYGVEACERIESVVAYDTVSNEVQELSNETCQFTYRNSLFKKAEGVKYIILRVRFVVSHSVSPRLSYKELHEHFNEQTSPTLSEVRNVIISIRKKKLPDWHIVGTAGSFFKNPILNTSEWEKLREKYSDIPAYPEKNGNVKLSLGWILDHVCNLRGYREGNVGLHEGQALVLVCEKGTSAHEIEMFVKKVIAHVFEKTGIIVEEEVRTLG